MKQLTRLSGVIFALLTLGLLGSGPVKGAGGGDASLGQKSVDASNTVAVLDFALDGPPSGANNWAIGLADFFALELQQRNVVLLERRDVRYLLSERRLSLTGAMAKDALVRQSLPSVKYLVQGNVKPTGDSRFSLVVGVVDAHSGLELHSFEASGAYPADWVKAIGKLAGQIASTLGGTASRSDSVPFGFTRQPELALRFYQGVSHCLDGRPELGLFTFRDLRFYDKNFLLCWIWEIRAWEMLGLKDHALIEEQELLALPRERGRELALQVALFRSHASNQVVVAVTGRGQATEQSRAAVEKLKGALVGFAGLRIFNPQYIQEISRERDLQLTGEFASPGEYDTGNWLAVDAIVIVEPLATANQLRIVVRDGLSGKALLTKDLNASAKWDPFLLESIRTALFGTTRPITDAEARLADNEQFWEDSLPKNIANSKQSMTVFRLHRELDTINPVLCHAYLLHQAMVHPEVPANLLVLRSCGTPTNGGTCTAESCWVSNPHSALFRKQYLELCSRQGVTPKWDPMGPYKPRPYADQKSIDKASPDYQLAVSMTNLLNQAEKTNATAAVELRLRFLHQMVSHWDSLSSNAVICLQPSGFADWLAMREYPPIYSGFIDTVNKLQASQLSQPQRAELKQLTCEYATGLSNLKVPYGPAGVVCQAWKRILSITFDLYFNAGCYDEALVFAQKWLDTTRKLVADQHHIDWTVCIKENCWLVSMPAYRERMWRVNAVSYMARVLNETKGALTRAEFVAAEQARYEKDYLVDSPVDEKLMPVQPIGEDYALAQMAAECWNATGRIDQSIKVLSHVYGSDRYCLLMRMHAAFDLAGYKEKNGSINEALDLYREVSDKCPGLEKAALKQMNLVRANSGMDFEGSIWMIPPSELKSVAPPPPSPDDPLARKAREIVFEELQPYWTNLSAAKAVAIMDDCVKSHGTNLFPALLASYKQYADSPVDSAPRRILCTLLEKMLLAEAKAGTALAMNIFRHDPEFAPIAFRVNADLARAIVDRNYPAMIEDTPRVHGNLARTIIEQRLVRHYPVLFACLRDCRNDASHARLQIITGLSEAITLAEPLEIRDGYEKALATRIRFGVYPQEWQAWFRTNMTIDFRNPAMPPNYPEAYEAALKRRMRAGVEGVTVGFTQFTPEKLKYLRGYLKLPAEDEAATAFLKAKPIEFEWLSP